MAQTVHKKLSPPEEPFQKNEVIIPASNMAESPDIEKPSDSGARNQPSSSIHFVEIDFELLALDPPVILQLSEQVGLNVHPFKWSPSRKFVALLAPFVAAMLAAYSAGAYGLTASELKPLWNLSSTTFGLGLTVFVLGFGIAPLVLALISELYGRYWVFVGSGTVFLLGTMGCAITQSFGGMLVSRMVTGCGASVFATLTGGVVGDLFPNQHRNTPMAVYSLVIMIGTGLGPLVSGALVDNLSWRWVFYLQMITIGLTTLGLLVLFHETRANVLLNRNCQLLNAHLDNLEGNGGSSWELFSEAVRANNSEKGQDTSPDTASLQQRLKIRFQTAENATGSVLASIGRSFRFPLMLLVKEPVVFWFSAWASFAWAILYMQFSSISLIYHTVYGFNNTEVGFVYITVLVGGALGFVASIAQHKILIRYFPSTLSRPENRLYFACGGSFLLPVGLFWFGWTAKSTIHWIVPTLAICSFETGIFIIYLAGFNYLADTYGIFASSALAAQSMCRNLLAGIVPLFIDAMFQNIGYGPSGSILGGIGIALSLVPWALVFYGETIRSRSKFMQQLSSG